jgi:antitoxin VapB
MALTIKNPEAERLAHEVAELTGETEAEAVRKALEERRLRLVPRSVDPVQEEDPVGRAERAERFWRHLEEDVWPKIPDELRRKGISKQEREEILGYGPEGV